MTEAEVVDPATDDYSDGCQFGNSEDNLNPSGKRNTVRVDERYQTYLCTFNSV